jgi:hypothetical protein
MTDVGIMPVPAELLSTLNKYRTCTSYRDNGTVSRKYEGSEFLSRTSEYSTEFERSNILLFHGHTRGTAGPCGVPAYLQPSWPAVRLGKWALSYDWNRSTFFNAPTDDKTLEDSVVSLDDALASAEVASLGGASFIPCLLLDNPVGQFWERLDDYTFTLLADSLHEVVIQGKYLSDNLQITINKETGLIAMIRRVQTAGLESPQILALEQAVELFSLPGSEEARMTRETIEILSKARNPNYTMESKYVYHSAAIT